MYSNIFNSIFTSCNREIGFICLIAVLLFSEIGYSAESEKRPSILIIGTAHFQNQGRDVVNVQIDDVMTPRRQGEIESFLESLEAYSPTHIAVEFSASAQSQVDEVYSSYLNDNVELRSNEQHQLGYRLGKSLGLSRIHAVDWNNNPPGDSEDYDWVTFGRENGMTRQINALLEPTDMPNIHDMSGQTISEWLTRINSPELLAAMHKPYFDIARISKEQQHPGADWVGAWYGRNLKIFNNVLRISDDPGSRILVIYGLGHAYLLNQFAVESDNFDVKYLSDYLD